MPAETNANGAANGNPGLNQSESSVGQHNSQSQTNQASGESSNTANGNVPVRTGCCHRCSRRSKILMFCFLPFALIYLALMFVVEIIFEIDIGCFYGICIEDPFAECVATCSCCTCCGTCCTCCACCACRDQPV